MPFPKASHLELPILQELKAVGGEDKVENLYKRLIPYFPQLTEAELKAKTKSGRNKWKSLVQRAGLLLSRKNYIERRGKGKWLLTEKGRERAEGEEIPVQLFLFREAETPPSHEELKKKLCEIGRILGKHVEEEYEGYDVIWKESELSPRISHVFEVQCRGKLESALTRLKHAYDIQRSKPFLVVADEKDAQKARKYLEPLLSGSFHEIGKVTTILSPAELDRLYRALNSVRDLLEKLLTE